MVAVAVGLALPAIRAGALTSTTITIDGQFDDWAGVRADPDNVALDTQIPTDPDWPGQPDRDLYYVNATYDDEYLYLCWRRTAGGVKAITFGAYIDLDGDGLLQEDRDVVVAWTVSDPVSEEPSQQNYDEQGRILAYYQARDDQGDLIYPEGDPMDHYGPPPTDQQNPPDPNWQDYRHEVPNGDGNTPDGWAIGAPQYDEYYPSKPMDAYLDYVSGIECEARVAWSDLGFSEDQVPPPIAIHFVSGNGEDFGTPNKPSLWPDDYKNTAGRLEEQNQGQVEDNVRGLYWLLGRGVSVEPDRVGSASADTTVTYTHTLTNQGNSSDVFALDVSSSQGWNVTYTLPDGSTPATVALGANESTTVVVHVGVPPGAANGTHDVTVLTATSQADASVTDSASDTTYVGDVTVTPDQAASVPPSTVVTYTHTITNNKGTSAVYDLTTSSVQGWTVGLYDSGGSAITSVSLAAGESTTVVLTVAVPSSAATGTQDVTKLRATDRSDPTTYDEARDTTTVRDGLVIAPDRSAFGGAGTTVSYRHTITNSWPTTRAIDVSASSSEGWDVRVYAEDGVTEVTSVTVGPYGATEDVIVRVFIPTDATASDTDTTTVTASVGGYSDTATDVTTVTQLATYDSPGYVNQTSDFVLGDTVYARGMGLGGYREVFFVWYDDDGTLVRTSPDLRVDAQEMAFDEYTTTENDPVGSGWTVKVFEAGDDPDTDPPIESVLFTVSYDAQITLLSATDAPSIGSTTTVDCTVHNSNNTTITASTITYVVWWDVDGDGAFGAGDIYMDSDGAPHTWDGFSSVSSHVTTGVTVPGGADWSDTSWYMSNTQFPNQGTYKVTATWTDSGGDLIDEATAEFYSIPTLGWPLFSFVAIVGVAYMWRRARTPGKRMDGEVRAS
ncbi:MAG: hypothetical protein Kow0056_08590 [Coriobacteriia bacterium]